MSRPAVAMPPPERIAERGRSKPRAGSRRDARVAGRCRRSGTTRRPASERRKRVRHRYPTQRTARGKIRHASTEAAGSACGTWLRMSRMIAVRVLVFMLATMRAIARGATASSALAPSPRAAWPRPPRARHRHSRERLDQPATTRICASTTWMRNHAGNDRMGRRSAATARSGDTTAAAYRRRGDDDMAET